MIDAIRTLPAGPAPTPERAGTAGDAPAFRALLERLQRLAAAEPPPSVTSADDLRDAVRSADSSFATAMDLRRQLEDAFRRHVR